MTKKKDTMDIVMTKTTPPFNVGDERKGLDKAQAEFLISHRRAEELKPKRTRNKTTDTKDDTVDVEETNETVDA